MMFRDKTGRMRTCLGGLEYFAVIKWSVVYAGVMGCVRAAYSKHIGMSVFDGALYIYSRIMNLSLYAATLP